MVQHTPGASLSVGSSPGEKKVKNGVLMRRKDSVLASVVRSPAARQQRAGVPAKKNPRQ